MIPDIYIQLAVALGLGLLVGLQRERRLGHCRHPDVRPDLSSRAISAQLAKTYGGWILVVGILSTALLLTAGNLVRQKGEAEPGQTTEFAALVVFGLGAWVVTGSNGRARGIELRKQPSATPPAEFPGSPARSA